MGLCNSLLENEEYEHDMNRKGQYLDVSFKKGWYRTTVPVVVREKPDHESQIIEQLKKGTRIEMVAFTNWFVKITSPVKGYIQFVTVEEFPIREECASGGGRGIELGHTKIMVQPGRLGLYFTDISTGLLGDLNPNPQEILKTVGVTSGWRLVDVEGNPFRMDVLKQYIDGTDPYHLTFEREGFTNNSYGDVMFVPARETDLVESSVQLNHIDSEKALEVVAEIETTPRNNSNSANHIRNGSRTRISIDENQSFGAEEDKQSNAKEEKAPRSPETRKRTVSDVKKMVKDYEEKICDEKRKIEKPISRSESALDKEDKKRDPCEKKSFAEDGDFITIASEKTTTTVTTTITTTTKEHKQQQKNNGEDQLTCEPPVTTILKKENTKVEVLPVDKSSEQNAPKTKHKKRRSVGLPTLSKCVSEPVRERKRTSKKKKKNSGRLRHSNTWIRAVQGDESTTEESEGPMGPIELGEPIPDTLSLYQIRRMKKVGRLLGDGFEPKKTHKRQVSETLQLLQQNGTILS